MSLEILTKYKLLLVGLAILFSSCAKSELLSHSDVQLNLKVGVAATAAANNETDINRLRVVVFGSLGSPDAGKLVLNKFYATTTSGTLLKEIITAGKRDIFIIANEPLSGSNQELDSYKNIATVADIRGLSLVYDGAVTVGTYIPAEIPMFIEHQNRQISVDSDNEISGELERTMAKVTLKLNVKNANFSADKFVVIDKMVIKNLPLSSFLKANIYSGALVTSESQNAAVIAPQGDYNYSSNNTFYVPEYIFGDDDSGAYFEITGHINGEPDSKSMWKVKLGDAMDDNKAYGTQYNITRNRHYTFTGDVKSYGETNDLAVKVTVKPWNSVDLSDNVGGYVSYSSVTDAAGGVIADGGLLDAMGTTLKVSCSTSVGGWYTVTSDAALKVVHVGTPTDAVSAVTTQTVDIVIPPLADITSVVDYTVSIYHPTIAPESVGPVKSLSFTQKLPFVEINGLKWATGNLVANGANGAKIGALTDGGLYFQFGSLVGWSGGATGDGTGTGQPALAINVHPSLYTGGTTWTTCGYYSDPVTSGGLPATDNALAGIGDPCRVYLGSPWRMPTAEEFKALCNNYEGGDSFVSANAAWTTSPAAGINFNNNKTEKLFIPASGYRNNSNGTVDGVGTDGYCWSESVSDAAGGYYLYFGSGTVRSQSRGDRRLGFPVRCVQGALTPAAISMTPTTQAGIPSGGGKYTVKVTSNYPWSASSSLGGVVFSPSSGSAGTDVSVEITVPFHTALTARSIPAVFTATGGGTTATATWTGSQAAAFVEINGVKWTIGNLVADGPNGAKAGAPADGGLYFQFGSLLGWKGGASGDGTGICTKADGMFFGGASFNAVNEIAVKPSVFTTIAGIGPTWPNQTQNLYYFGLSSYSTTDARLRDFTGLSNGSLAASGVGDPCRFYLGSPWRMPTAEEFKALCNNYEGGDSFVSANAAWTTSPAAGINFNNNKTEKLFIPVSGYRNSSDDAVDGVGTYGHCWSESVRNTTYGYTLHINSRLVYPQYGGIRRNGYPVRCVQ